MWDEWVRQREHRQRVERDITAAEWMGVGAASLGIGALMFAAFLPRKPVSSSPPTTEMNISVTLPNSQSFVVSAIT